jgi:hypothetical protein
VGPVRLWSMMPLIESGGIPRAINLATNPLRT